MSKEMKRAAQRMLARAAELGLVTKDGKPVVVDLMEELLAASAGHRNAHTYRSHLARCEPAALEQEHPDEAPCDYKLVNGRGCWISMGAFSVHPYLTDEGVVVDVYAKGAENDSIASTYAFDTDALESYCEDQDIDFDEAVQWACGMGAGNFPALSAAEQLAWLQRYAQSLSQAARHAEQRAQWKAALQEVGYRFEQAGDQPGRWVWLKEKDACESSFESEAEAIADAWRFASDRAMRMFLLIEQKWDQMTFDEQRDLLRSSNS